MGPTSSDSTASLRDGKGERATEQTCERKRKNERERERKRKLGREREGARERDTWGRERGRDWLSRSRKSPPGCSTGRHFAQFSTALRLKRSFRDTFSLSLSLSSRSASRDRLLDLGIPRSLRERLVASRESREKQNPDPDSSWEESRETRGLKG